MKPKEQPIDLSPVIGLLSFLSIPFTILTSMALWHHGPEFLHVGDGTPFGIAVMILCVIEFMFGGMTLLGGDV